IGYGAIATGSVAVGAFAQASNGGAAFGDGAVATGASATAIGQNAVATASNSVAIGAGSVASAPNTASFGSPRNERRLTDIAPGVSPTDAATFGQVSGVQTQVDTNRTEARRGIAATAAMGIAMTPSRPGKTTVSMNTGFFKGETGVGVAVAHRLNF